jgi:uncharacterized protein YfaS (alpha-2-macroglobulin family)
VPAQGITATIGGKELATSPSDNATGYIKRDITKLAKGGEELKIVKPGKYPSWGSVMTRGEMAMERIDPVSIPDLSISKSLYRATNHGDSITWETTNSYRLGDRLKVDLLITTARDMDYVVITDQRGACLEPVEQLPRPVVAERIYFYLENRDAVTNIFVDRLPKGTYHISYEMSVNNAGRFSAGAATIQSQYSPALTAHSSGEIINVETGR